jgi:hypothetical protein
VLWERLGDYHRRLQHWIGHGAAIIRVREFATWKIGDVGSSGWALWCGSELTHVFSFAFFSFGFFSGNFSHGLHFFDY